VGIVDSESTDWVDRRALDHHGEMIGTVVDVYDDVQTGRAKWLVVSTGYFGTRRAVAPANGASFLGDDVVMSHSKAVIVAAPAVHTYTAIVADDERAVTAHYARHGTPPPGDHEKRQHP
jgi:uncharacterized protein YrrD